MPMLMLLAVLSSNHREGPYRVGHRDLTARYSHCNDASHKFGHLRVERAMNIVMKYATPLNQPAA